MLHLRVLAKMHGNGCMRVYENSTHSITCHFQMPPHISAQKLYRYKLESMRNNSVVSFYDNFALICKGSEDKATENWSPSTTPLLIDNSSHANRRANIRINLLLLETTVSGKYFCRWQYGSISSFVFT